MADEKTQELIEKLEAGIKETMNSENYKAYLNFQSRFHSYSFNNVLLIKMQRPNATYVAGYNAWQDMGRHVMKGEKGISILAPSPYKTKKEVDVIDPATKRPVIDPGTGKVKKEEKIVEHLSFKKVTVFDVSQTDGKELPSICKELDGNSTSAASIIKAIKNISEVPIVEKVITDGAKGYYSRLENIIAVNKGMSLDQTAKTLIHELAHSRLHNTESTASLDRATKEVQAESVAYIVSNNFGVDTSEYSFDYLATWSTGRELPELRASLSLIQKAADKIIKEVEDELFKEYQLQNDTFKVKILWSESYDLQDGQILGIHDANKLFQELVAKQFELRKNNENLKAGSQENYVPYLKTRFQIELPHYHNIEARIDIGDGLYKDLFDCVKNECYVDIVDYLNKYSISEIGSVTKIDNIFQEPVNVKNKIIDLYSKEFKPIKYITVETAKIIDNLNTHSNKILTIKEIKQQYKEMGKKLESSHDESDIKDFKLLSNVVDDLKAAKLAQKQNEANIKSLQQDNQISKSNSFELAQ